jgi:hypothetical protein
VVLQAKGKKFVFPIAPARTVSGSSVAVFLGRVLLAGSDAEGLPSGQFNIRKQEFSRCAMSKETPKDDPKERDDGGSRKQTVA